MPIYFEGIVGAGTDSASWLAASPNVYAGKVCLHWISSRDDQSPVQKLTGENSLRRQRQSRHR